MASVVQICNMALSHVGASARVSSISPPDGSVEAGYCASFYDLARTSLIEPGNWRFTLARKSLALLATNPSTIWAYAYALPSDCLSPRRVMRVLDGVTVFTQDDRQYQPTDRGSATFDIEGDVLYTNEPEAVLLYVRDVTDTNKFTPSFVSALSYMLASYLAGPIVKGNEGARLGEAMRQRAVQEAMVSAAASANASSGEMDFTPSSVEARA